MHEERSIALAACIKTHQEVRTPSPLGAIRLRTDKEAACWLKYSKGEKKVEEHSHWTHTAYSEAGSVQWAH